MNLAELLRFVPLGVGLFLAYHLIMKEGLPNKNLGKIASYFLGILLVFLAIGWLINSFFTSWANDMLQKAGSSDDLNSLIDTSSGIIQNAFGTGSSDIEAQPAPAPTQPAPVTAPGGVAAPQTQPTDQSAAPATGPQTYTVATGDTLYDIALRHGSTVDAIMQANGLTSYVIQPGQQLRIPAAP